VKISVFPAAQPARPRSWRRGFHLGLLAGFSSRLRAAPGDAAFVAGQFPCADVRGEENRFDGNIRGAGSFFGVGGPRLPQTFLLPSGTVASQHRQRRLRFLAIASGAADLVEPFLQRCEIGGRQLELGSTQSRTSSTAPMTGHVRILAATDDARSHRSVDAGRTCCRAFAFRGALTSPAMSTNCDSGLPSLQANDLGRSIIESGTRPSRHSFDGAERIVRGWPWRR
jgi:hypothetical protein